VKRYPEDCIQDCIQGEWWIEQKKLDLRRGRLVRALVPHVELVPLAMTGSERNDPRDHTTATVKFQQLNIREKRSPASILPIAGLADYDGEHYIVQRAKVRPALVIDCDCDYPNPEHGQAKWQTHPTMSIIPIYGCDQSDKRAGWPPRLLQAIRRVKWPQYLWDKLPIDGPTKESVMMLNRIMPIGRHQNYYEVLPWFLSDQALAIVDEWLDWLRTGEFDETSELLLYRTMLQELG
jgi:hypothetical protein